MDFYFFPILDIYTPIDRTILRYKELFSPIRRFSMKKAAVIHGMSGFPESVLTAANLPYPHLACSVVGTTAY